MCRNKHSILPKQVFALCSNLNNSIKLNFIMIKIKICNEEFNVSDIFCLLTLIKLRDLVIIIRLSVISLRDKKEEESKKIYIIEPIPVLARPAGQGKSKRLHNVVQLYVIKMKVSKHTTKAG